MAGERCSSSAVASSATALAAFARHRNTALRGAALHGLLHAGLGHDGALGLACFTAAANWLPITIVARCLLLRAARAVLSFRRRGGQSSGIKSAHRAIRLREIRGVSRIAVAPVGQVFDEVVHELDVRRRGMGSLR